MYDYLFVVIAIIIIFTLGRLLRLERRLRKMEIELKGRETGEPFKAGKEPIRRKRYVVFQIIGEDLPKRTEELEPLIQDLVKSALGDMGQSECRPTLVYYSARRRRGVIRTYRECSDRLAASLSVIRTLGGRRVMFVPIRVTGTLKRARWHLFDKNISR